MKRYLKSGIMENGVVVKIEEGLPQGGSLFLLLANSYRDKCLPEEMFHASAAQMTLYFWEKADTPRRRPATAGIIGEYSKRGHYTWR
ncbi:hypothetical protein AB840_07120 [Megasphaera cerevisiae DSM 20462]|uniref:Uncharacterized protein n=1 Tax=Megasphaera cerevisiae DSM 20462 TaxID=1122219 RepID=A0A0J6WWK4_9FIRM|nr:hypothetical protein [Megasphaera cerevisiae]KMO86578.1 hypothetical protein AB840_07120 [Megasphaera cerevisiae DSM 20462]OKY52412.1 hypothetical protein BSR42_12980 [Megasphaera cerevisiae]SJZ69192.1 hypothetical protein SAMN05660900_01175 [Megasphaera cerevisiae DSM 20462]